MGQIHILHAMSVSEYAEDLAHGLERAGYSTTWDGQDGPLAAMSGKTLERAHNSVCVPMWTIDLWSSKWTHQAVENAHKCNRLVQIALDPVGAPIEDAGEPLDFSQWKGEYDTPLWKAFIARIREVAGRPTGRLPLKEEAQPALSVMFLGVAAVAGIMAGGVPSFHVQSDSMALLTPPPAPQASAASMGGPVAGLHEPASAYALSTHVHARFERIDPAPKVQIVTLKQFGVQPSEVASAAPAPGASADASDRPASSQS